MRADALYHSGIVVEDFDATLEWFTRVAGYQWGELFAGDVTVSTPAGDVVVPMRIAYSVDEPRLEILQAAEGTLWMPADSGVHHLGYWSDDVDADLATLLAEGLTLEAVAPMPDGSALWAYCKPPTGPRIELVSRVIEPALTEMFAAARAGDR